MLPKIDFIVIDTEGNPHLNEIAIINSSGQLIYEAFAREHLNHDGRKLNVKLLKEIITDVLSMAENKLIVCHYADHDRQILHNSCQKFGIAWQNLMFRCTYELAKAQFQNLPSHSLEYLSKHLHLRVNKKPFNPNFAHTARYDAEFTYQLYLKIMNPNPKPTRL